MTEDPAADLVRWVKEGEHLFRLTLESLQGAAALGSKVEELSQEARRLRDENDALRRELDLLRAERLEVADTFKAFAEHVTRLATLALHRLGNPGLLTDEAARAPQIPRRP
jgi:regulator of replication initiation timing